MAMLSWLKRSLSKSASTRESTTPPTTGPVRIQRSDHNISRSAISENALKVLYRLRKGGYESYLVGGGVRDLLLGREPKDFDVATDATPDEVKTLFRNCRLVGRRFRLAHVRFGREVIEVATFRAGHDGEGEGVSENGMLLRDNVYGTLEDDAWRRDFTVNALYYDINDFAVVDHTGGVEDLKAGRLRIIGDPETRYREDPVRMLRAVRFAAKLGFRIDEASEKAILDLGQTLEEIPPARLFDESLKLFLGGYAVETYELLRHYHLFEYLFPYTEVALEHEEGNFPHVMIARALENTDIRIQEERPVTPAFLFAALLWDPVKECAQELMQGKCSPLQAMQMAGDEIVEKQVKHVAFPKRFTLQSREIWTMQERLNKRTGSAFRLVTHPRFRAAYDFLLLRAESGEPVKELAEWWTRFQEVDDDGKRELINSLRGSDGGNGRNKKRRRRPRTRKPRSAEQS